MAELMTNEEANEDASIYKKPLIHEPMNETVQESSPRISDHRYTRAFGNILLLRSMEEIDNNEVKRLLSLLESPDYENWVVAEECIKQKLNYQ